MSPTRIKTLNLTIFLSFFLVAGRLFYWQIIKNSDLKKEALGQTHKLEKIEPSRGKIFTSDSFPLVRNQTNFLLSIYKPNLETDLGSIINQIDLIKPNFKTDNRQLLNDFQKNPQKSWITFPSLFNHQQSQSLKLSGLSFQKIDTRFYPENELAWQVTGTLAKNQQGNLIGYHGLEGYYQKQLKGRAGFSWVSQDATGETILSKKTWQSAVIPGRNLHTFLNRPLQHLAESKLKQALADHQAESGSIIILQPQTGAVLAMTSAESSPSATSPNPAISHLFEPGSIFKPLVVAMALDNNSIHPDHTCSKCHQSRTIGDHTIENWDQKVHPNTNLKDIIKNSDNIAMSWIIQELGLKNFLQFFEQLKLHQKTGIDLQGEAKALKKDYWSPLDLATASFGQGFATTQIQTIQAFNTLANNGQLIQPRLVNFLTENDKIIKPKKTLTVPVFKPKTVNSVNLLLKYAVDNSNLNKLNSKKLDICAKSGTAQIAQQGSYQPDQTIASFIGFSPCQKPKFTMLVSLVKPKTSPWGSTTAAPVWFDLAEKIEHLL